VILDDRIADVSTIDPIYGLEIQRGISNRMVESVMLCFDNAPAPFGHFLDVALRDRFGLGSH